MRHTKEYKMQKGEINRLIFELGVCRAPIEKQDIREELQEVIKQGPLPPVLAGGFLN